MLVLLPSPSRVMGSPSLPFSILHRMVPPSPDLKYSTATVPSPALTMFTIH